MERDLSILHSRNRRHPNYLDAGGFQFYPELPGLAFFRQHNGHQQFRRKRGDRLMHHQ